MRINITMKEFEKFDLDFTDPNFSEIAVNYLQDNYFNGADNAVIYMGCDYNSFEFEIMPN